MLTYALITPARNEEAHLEEVIRFGRGTDGLARQVGNRQRRFNGSDRRDRSALMPRSTPGSALLRRERSDARHFAGKAHAVNAAYETLRPLSFDLIGNLDADITLPPDYYEFLVSKFVPMPDLGVAGTPFVEDAAKPRAHSYAHRFADLSHVSGACQFFRRRIFDDIGGYTPVRAGWHRLGCCHDSPYARMEDADLSGTRLFAPSRDGDRGS